MKLTKDQIRKIADQIAAELESDSPDLRPGDTCDFTYRLNVVADNEADEPTICITRD